MIELIEKVDEHWYYATNADTGFCEGLVLATELNIIKRLPGKTTVEGFDDGPCAVATHAFEGREFRRCLQLVWQAYWTYSQVGGGLRQSLRNQAVWYLQSVHANTIPIIGPTLDPAILQLKICQFLFHTSTNSL